MVGLAETKRGEDEGSGWRACDGGAGDAVGAVLELFNKRVFFFIIQAISPNLRGCSVGIRQLDLRFRADKLLNTTRPNCLCVGLRTSVTLKMSKLVNAKDWRNYSCLVTKWEWLGVSMHILDESAIRAVNGREFIAYSTRQKGVFKTSSVRRRVLRMVESAHSKLWKSLSQMPHWFRAPGGLNLHFMPLRASSATKLREVHFSIHSRSSFSTPINLVSSYCQFLARIRGRETNCYTPVTQELLSINGRLQQEQHELSDSWKKTRLLTTVRKTVT